MTSARTKVRRILLLLLFASVIIIGFLLYSFGPGGRHDRTPNKDVTSKPGTGPAICKDSDGAVYSEGALIRGQDGKIQRCEDGRWQVQP
jgi:hypothetical protein